ncbi:hypothetical protein C0Z01_11285 [Photobacterium kishitanii]|uniref:DUF6892 domain-containing protein n=1 Tax=Photobacterium kishitanii TaxID=318456 RepID=UPI0007EFF89D|nr:hypothetical protein [Photobacterium kishitanii]OBU29057.1 hypothetical protein AYY22_00530 [Photobacterium kishitanii]PSW69382.1 hypothetical protein C0Z01_11285 [Photobacterium kishitanii]
MDDNLKLLVLGDLYLSDEIIKKYIDDISDMGFSDLIYGDNRKYQWFDCIPEVKSLLLSIDITDEQFEKVTLLSGECCETHFLIMPNWDGEGDEFDLQSLTGTEKIKNLECLDLLNLSKVRNVDKLCDLNIKEINSCEGLDADIMDKLREKGTVFY